MLLPTSVVVWLGWISIPSLAVVVSSLVLGLLVPEFYEVFRGVAPALLGVGSDIFLASVN